VVGGTDDSGDPAVVAFLAGGLTVCSGTLVAPEAVLTAGHCAHALGDVPYRVALGSDATHPARTISVAEQVLHPRYTGEGQPYDFALLHLAEPVEDVAPLPLSTEPLTQADVGAPIRHVGFGVSDPTTGDGAGIKRQVTYPITEVDPLVVWSGAPGEQTCTGDSGGPGLVARAGGERLAAVVSDGPDCYDAGWDGRVDVVADWVTATTAPWVPDAGPGSDAGAPPTPPRHSGCTSVPGWDLALLGWLGLLGRLPRRRRL
jgi:secreted trypsin-like serine protease